MTRWEDERKTLRVYRVVPYSGTPVPYNRYLYGVYLYLYPDSYLVQGYTQYTRFGTAEHAPT
jgi:hypothetical protein